MSFETVNIFQIPKIIIAVVSAMRNIIYEGGLLIRWWCFGGKSQPHHLYRNRGPLYSPPLCHFGTTTPTVVRSTKPEVAKMDVTSLMM
jgi:hypothetical protein